MNDFGFPKREKKEISELNVVPILDMFVSIVFFLIISASMIGMTKIVLPPSATAAIDSGSQKIPVNAKLLIVSSDKNKQGVKAILRWEGVKPGSESLLLGEDVFSGQKDIITKLSEMMKRFKTQFPNEKTIQISLQSEIPYQWLISAMDSVRDTLPDIVLNSYTLADSVKE